VNFSTDLKTISDIAAKFEGKSFDSPNDLVFRSDGNLYFTDPDFQAGSHKDQKSTNVYRVSPSGEVSVVDATINNPNGIALAPDESALYVAGNLEQGFVKRYPIAPDGSVGEGSLLIAHVVVPDGMVFDCAGNLYVTEHTQRRVRVFAPTGNEVATISGMDKNVTNVAFGGTDRTTLFITTTGGLYEIELPVPGLPY
jgi:gluconolactonase